MAKFVTAIVLGETSPQDPHVKKLEEFFRTISVQVTTNMGDLREVVQHYATHSHPDLPVLFIQDSSIIDTVPALFHDEISNALDYSWDLYYLGGYHDRCHQQITVTDRISITTTIKGHQAVLYRPIPLRGIAAQAKGEKNKSYTELLSELLANGNYRAVVRHPHLVHFDHNLARSHGDLARGNRCIPVDPIAKPSHATWWIAVIVLIVVLMIVAAGLIWHRGISSYNSQSYSYAANYPAVATPTGGM